MKILALDLGDKWVGTAISDPLKITCKPYQTIELKELDSFLKSLLEQERISCVVVGYPKTISGTHSDQTKKIIEQKEALEKKYAQVGARTIEWILWDERLSSKRAEQMMSVAQLRDKQEKKKIHSIAASFVLQSYLDYLAMQRTDY